MSLRTHRLKLLIDDWHATMSRLPGSFQNLVIQTDKYLKRTCYRILYTMNKCNVRRRAEQIFVGIFCFEPMQVLEISDDDIQNKEIYRIAGNCIKEGGLVAFPTETVYGLGANGLNATAVNKIFSVKKRPASDPVILHVLNSEDALKLYDESAEVIEVMKQVHKHFWPGPLTIVANAAAHIPAEVGAMTGTVAVRCPAHPVARELIAASECPIAAPSANLFSRVSPTKAAHVIKYFESENICLIKKDFESCVHGVESTVMQIKLEQEKVSIYFLRDGAITPTMVSKKLVGVNIYAKVLNTLGAHRDEAPSIAPGMCLIHYSPRVSTFFVIGDAITSASMIARGLPMENLFVLDLTGKSPDLSAANWYRDSSVDGTAGSVATNLFSNFHEIEALANDSDAKLAIVIDKTSVTSEEYAGIVDRCIRAAGHNVINF